MFLIISQNEKLSIIPAEIFDVGGRGRATDLYQRLSPECKPKPQEKSEQISHNPFVVSIAANANPTMRKVLLTTLEKTIRKHIEFELLYPALREHFKQMPAETVTQIAKILCEEMTASQIAEPENKLHDVLKQFQKQTNAQDLQAIEQILRNHSTIFSMDDPKLAQITRCIEKLKSNTKDIDVLAKIDKVSQAMIDPVSSSPLSRRRRL